MDMVIRGGTVVTAGSIASADVGIQDGLVAQIGGEMAAPREIDARGRLVLPGGIDMHVHLSMAGDVVGGAGALEFVDDFYSGTATAAAGGVTTVNNIFFPRAGEGPLAAVERTAADGRANAIADFTLTPVIMDPSPKAIADIPRLAEAGYTGIKIFTVLRPFDERVEDYLRAVAAAGRCGMVTMIHCEDAPLIAFAEERLLAEGKTDVRYFPDSHPAYSEAVATARAIALAEATGAPTYIVHLSCAAALAECRRARNRGLPVYVETRPAYLYLTRERFLEHDGPKYVSWPPLRTQADLDALWEGLRAGDIDTVCTDHSPWKLAPKLEPGLKVGSFRPGMPALETLMPMLYSEGVGKGRISLSRFVEVTATNAAKLFGMYPQKGTIAVGADADLAVWDPQRRRTVRAQETHTNSDFDVFEGWEVQGWPVYTISRGEVIFDNGKVTGARGRGRPVRRGRHQPL